GYPGGLGRVVVDAGGLEGPAHADDVAGLRDDLPGVAVVIDLFRAGLEHHLEEGVLLRSRRLGDDDDPLAVEEVRDRARVGEAPTVAGQGRPDLGRGAVAVVGEALDEQGDTAGRIALVGDRLVVGRSGLVPGAALDGTVDVVVGDRGLLGLLDRIEEGRVARRVGTPGAGRD